MPVVTISLYNQVADTDVNNKLWLDQVGRFISNAQIIKDISEFYLKFGRSITLHAPMTFEQTIINILDFVWVGLSPASNGGDAFGGLHGIMVNHVLSGGLMDQVAIGFGGKFKTESIRFTSDFNGVTIQSMADFLAPIEGVTLTKISDVWLSPPARAFQAAVALSVAIRAANNTCATFLARPFFSVVSIAAENGTKPFLIVSSLCRFADRIVAILTRIIWIRHDDLQSMIGGDYIPIYRKVKTQCAWDIMGYKMGYNGI